MSSGRLEEELDEILKNAEDLPDSQKPRKGRGKTPRGPRRAPPSFLSALTPGKLFIAGIALILSALILGDILFWFGLVVCIVAYALFVQRGRKPASGPRWRGKPVDYGPSHGPSWWDRVRGWFQH